MKFAIYSLQQTLFEGKAEKIIAKTPSGEITVLDNHVPLISSLVGPEIVFFEQEQRNSVAIESGFLEVRPNKKVVALINQ